MVRSAPGVMGSALRTGRIKRLYSSRQAFDRAWPTRISVPPRVTTARADGPDDADGGSSPKGRVARASSRSFDSEAPVRAVRTRPSGATTQMNTAS